jgi:prepilin-type processing-associated H-X9-DG protein
MTRIYRLKPKAAFTFVEMLIVLVLIIVLAIILWPSNTEKKARTINCLSNLKQIGIGLKLYADDDNGRFPLQISATNSGTTEFIKSVPIFSRFQIASNEFGNSTKILICPFDTKRHAATDFKTLTDSNISYFLNADAMTTSPDSMLSGDRFLQVNGRPVKPGLFMLTTNLHVTWTPGVHNGGGNLLLSDGSAEQTENGMLPTIIQRQLFDTNRILIP